MCERDRYMGVVASSRNIMEDVNVEDDVSENALLGNDEDEENKTLLTEFNKYEHN